MASINPIGNILDNAFPLTRLAALVQVVKDLQAQLAALQATVDARTGSECPKCKGFAFRLIESHATLGVAGAVHVRGWVYRRATCNHEEIQQISALGTPTLASVSVDPVLHFTLNARAITQLEERA
jgi:hypothetical protein